MRDTIFAKCDSEFVAAAIKKKKRLDGRRFDELRSIELHFGSDFGCAYVTLGETKVLAQISCELSEPRNVRKNEGNLFVNVEIHDMVCGVFETGHHAHLAVHTNRLIEKCIKDSRCVDLEALCIVSEEQAWEIRVDVSVLNYDGNLVTCCSLAALAALAHFKTPHVTIENSEIRIDSIKEHEPEPLSLHHYPILVAFAIFGENDDILLDPTELEEKVCESELVIGMNSFNELCGMHFSGRTTSNRLLIVNASRQASLVAGELVKLVKTKLEIDNETRRKNRGKSEGLVTAIHTDRILSASQDRSTLRVTQREIEETARSFLEDRQKMKVSEVESDSTQIPEPSEDMDTEEMRPVFRKDQKRGVEVPPMSSFGQDWAPSGNRNAWTLPNATLSDAESDDDEDDVDFVKTITDEDRIIDRIELNDSEEEHDTIVLQPKACQQTQRPSSADGSDVRQEPSSTVISPWPDDEFPNGAMDSSSYSMTSPSFSSNTSISTSMESNDSCKPNYNPPKPGHNDLASESFRFKKRNQLVFSPSSPSSSDDNSQPTSSEAVLPTTIQSASSVPSYKRNREPLRYAKKKRVRRVNSSKERSRFSASVTPNREASTSNSSRLPHIYTPEQPSTSQFPSESLDSPKDRTVRYPLGSSKSRIKSSKLNFPTSHNSADSSLESLSQNVPSQMPSTSQRSVSNVHGKSSVQRSKQRKRNPVRRHHPVSCNHSSTSSSKLDRSSSPPADNCSSPVPTGSSPPILCSDSSNVLRPMKFDRFSPTPGTSNVGALPQVSYSNSNFNSSDESKGYKKWARKVKRRISTGSSSQSSRAKPRIPRMENLDERVKTLDQESDADSSIPSPKYSPSSNPLACPENLPPYSPSSPSTSVAQSSIPSSAKRSRTDTRIKTEVSADAPDGTNVLPTGSRLPPYTLEWLMGSSTAALGGTLKSHLSDSVFSASGSPELPDFSPSSPSHHPPSPAFSPSSPSYSSGSCTSPDESPVPQNGVANGDLQDGNCSSDDLLSPTYSPTSPKYSSASSSSPGNPTSSLFQEIEGDSCPGSVSPTSPNYSSGPSSPLNGSYELPQEQRNASACSSPATLQGPELLSPSPPILAEPQTPTTRSAETLSEARNPASQDVPGSSVVSRSPELPRYSPSSPSHQPPSPTLSPTSPQYSSDADSLPDLSGSQVAIDRLPDPSVLSFGRDGSQPSSPSSSPTSPKYSSASCDSLRPYDPLDFRPIGGDERTSRASSREQPYSPSSPSIQLSPSFTALLSSSSGSSTSQDGFSDQPSPLITDSVSLAQSVASSLMSQAMSPIIPSFSPSSPSSSDSQLSPISSQSWTSASERPALSRSSRSSSTSAAGTTLVLKVVLPKP